MTSPAPEPPAGPPRPLVLADDEYAVGWAPGRPRDPEIVDPVGAVQAVGGGIVQRVGAGLELLRATAGLGLRLVGRHALPRALPVGLTTPVTRFDAPRVVLRRGGRDLPVDRESLDLGYPLATGDLVVFLPGAGDDEGVWNRRGDVPAYPAQLARLLDWTPVHLQATGAPPSALAPSLSGLLQALVDDWPVQVRRIALVGHGAGGLVLRAAAGVQPCAPRPWTDLVTHLVVLGTPHLVVPPTRVGTPVGREVERRLAGIITTDEADPDVAPLPRARQVVITAAARHPRGAGALLGGLLWWRHSATGRGRRARLLFPDAERFEVDAGQAPLSQHPEVAGALLEWLAPH